MTDVGYRLTKQEETSLEGNANNGKIRVKNDNKLHRGPLVSNATVLVFFIVLLVLTCLALAISLALEKIHQSKTCARIMKDNSTSSKTSDNKTPMMTCSSGPCILAASNILQTVDYAINPCDDFFLHACGGWIKNNPIPSNEPQWNKQLILKARNDQLLKRLLGDDKIRHKYVKNDAVQKALRYYDTCTNYKLIELADGEPLIRLVESYGSWNITNSSWSIEDWHFVETLAMMHKNLKISPLVKVDVHPDLINSSRYIIMLDQPSHTITRDAYLANTSHDLNVRKAYKQLMFDLVSLLGGNSKSVPQQLEEIFELERTLMKVSLTADERVDQSKLYKVMSVKELQQETLGQINWLRFLQIMFQDSGYEITENEKIAIFALEYLKKLSNITANTSERILANYMMWQAVVELAPHMSEKYRTIFFNFRKVVTGRTGETDVWQKCLKEMSAYDNDIGEPLGLIFLGEKFDEKDKKSVMSMIADVRDTFIRNIDHLDWMDDKTKAYAKEKATSMRQNIGYPEYLMNQSKFTARFSELNLTNESYFTNVINLRAFSVKSMLKDLRKSVDKERWMIHPHSVNAFYDRVTNKIIFPAGILQVPFYSREFPRAISYGGIGIVVAHEITHGFDSNGRKYNKNGDLKNWWSCSSNKAFEDKSKCFVDQYSSYEAYGKKLNGLQTLGENIADNGAIKQAFEAYKEWVKRNGEEPQLPAVNFTNEQLFFISAAQVDCGAALEPVALKKIEQATHTLEHWRVIGEMSNSKEFAKAFNCPLGSKMNPQKKCSIW